METECINWFGRVEGGYGRLGKRKLAHRAAWEDANQACLLPFPKAIVRHLCNNPLCVNPKHLAAGSAKENAADRTAAGRTDTVSGMRVRMANAAAKTTCKLGHPLNTSRVCRTCKNEYQRAYRAKEKT